MFNFHIPDLPARSSKPRQIGITMAMDKGIGLKTAQDIAENACQYVDFIKLGWCTSLLTPKLKEKLALYREHQIEPYFGGTLMEAYLIRNAWELFLKVLDTFEMRVVEISDGSLDMPHPEKLRYIRYFKERGYTVLSEVGSKDASKVMPPYKWIEIIKAELEAGSQWVIAEARESGTVGMYRPTGEVREGLIEEVVIHIPHEKILFEAPQRNQQVWLIKRFGTNVNLGNISIDDLIGLETLRLGLRGDTFHTFLPK